MDIAYEPKTCRIILPNGTSFDITYQTTGSAGEWARFYVMKDGEQVLAMSVNQANVAAIVTPEGMKHVYGK